jgi:hypothetical protein
VAQLWSLGLVAMKTAIILLILGLVIGLVIPYFVQDIITGAGVELKGFWFSKSPQNFSFSVPVVLRVIGIILVLLAIIRFIVVRGSRV